MIRVSGVRVGPLDLSALEPVVRKDLQWRANRVAAAARRQVGVKTGRLQSSITTRTYRMSAFVTASAPYVMYHHDGTEPHMIYPRRARVLRFVVAGRVVFAARVRHPGTRPNRFLTDSIKYARR